MAGPNGTPLLDSFTGGLSANWTADPFNFGLGLFVGAGNAATFQAGGFAAMTWNASFTADQEAWMTIPTLPDGNVRLFARLTSQNSSATNGYGVVVSPASTDLYRVDATALVFLSSTGFVAAAGNKVAITCVGSTISCYKDVGAGWVFVSSVTDATYSAGGFVGPYSQANTTLSIDDFGGGSLAGPTPPPTFLPTFARIHYS